MSITSRYEYLAAIRPRYQRASKAQKEVMLDEFCATCQYNRKYAIRLLNATALSPVRKNLSKRGRKKRYTDPLILEILTDIWVKTNLPCAKRLKALLPLWLPFYDKFIVPENVYQALMSISAATIDRLMAPYRAKYTKRGLATTKPGSLLKKHIPIKTNQWNEKVPGFLEADAVAHCGQSTAGMFVYTINCVDIATGWTEQRAIWGRGERGTLAAIQNTEHALPFPLRGFDCDNGAEFLNWHLYRYFTKRKTPVQFTRARAYHKNDNAHIESKNWTHIRQYLGYQRFERFELVDLLNDLYTTEWNSYFNFFIPSVKLLAKVRNGARITKKYDQPKTPLQRILESPYVSEETKQRLSEHCKHLNPFEIQDRMSRKIKAIIDQVTNQDRQRLDEVIHISTVFTKRRKKKEPKKKEEKVLLL